MDPHQDIPQPAKRSPAHRSRVANGSKLLPLTDGRSATARRFKDLIDDISGDLGGADYLSEGQRQLIRRAAMLSAESERLETMWARGEAQFDIGAYAVLSNALRRVLETIGLKRVAREAATLADYLEPRPMPPSSRRANDGRDPYHHRGR
jgi:hypothetical protein